MKIYLASYFEIDKHGPGRSIGIAPSKPKNLMETNNYECDLCHEYLSPEKLYWDYHSEKKQAAGNEELLKQAGDKFVSEYNKRLEDFRNDLNEEVVKTGKTIEELIGFKDGDTLLSWEKGGNTSHRQAAGDFLKTLGYEVEIN